MPDTARKSKTQAKITPKASARTTPAAVLTYLQNNPQFFEKHKSQLENLVTAPKKGRMPGNILSLHALKAEKADKQAEQLRIRQRQLISTARENALVAESIFTAVLHLIACNSLADLRKYLQNGLTSHLNLTAVRLFGVSEQETATTLTARQIADLCPTAIAMGPLNASIHRPLFGPKTNQLRSICLMALTEADGTYLGLLAMGSDDETRFHAGQGTVLAEFFRQAAGTILSKLA
jgi:hypothetical protein